MPAEAMIITGGDPRHYEFGNISSFVSAVPGNMATGIDPAHSERAS